MSAVPGASRARRPRLLSLSLLLLSLVSGMLGSCSKEKQKSQVVQKVEAMAMGHAECAACGMVVREQPAPRVQVVHRDGKRVFFCSVGDSLHYLKDQGSHGKAQGVFVEALAADADPQVLVHQEQAWIPAEKANYVTGIERSGIMGEPVLSYRSEEEAAASAKKNQGTVKTWKQLSAPGASAVP